MVGPPERPRARRIRSDRHDGRLDLHPPPKNSKDRGPEAYIWPAAGRFPARNRPASKPDVRVHLVGALSAAWRKPDSRLYRARFVPGRCRNPRDEDACAAAFPKAFMRQLLKQIPGAAKMVRDARYLTMLARERWFTDRRIMNDNSHLLHEWDFGSLTNQDRYMRLLALVKNLKGTAHWGDVLEIGCSEGLFTALLAANCQTLTACDISQVACERTALSLSKCSNLRVKTMDLDFDPIVGSFDLVFAMDVLEFIHGRDRLARVGRKLAEALRPGGILIV